MPPAEATPTGDGRTGVCIAGHLVHAVVLDLDTVLDGIARLRVAAWRSVLDEALAVRAPGAAGFDPVVDYQRHVGGRPARDGVREFLADRGITLPDGDPAEPPGDATVWQLANAGRARLSTLLAAEGVRASAGALALLRQLRSVRIPMAIVTISDDAGGLLAAAGASGVAEVVIDRAAAERMRLAGKPEPAMLLEAARALGVAPDEIAAVDDTGPGVSAARHGGFALVVGVGRVGRATDLIEAGAHVVIDDLAHVPVEAVPGPLPPPAQPVCAGGTAQGSWTLRFDGYDPRLAGRREVLCTVGNGYLVTRGAVAEARAGAVHYPGTYLAGVYNRLVRTVAGQPVEQEHLVNVPNWLSFGFRTLDGQWFDPDAADLIDYVTVLDLRRATLERRLRLRDRDGRITAVSQLRFVSMAEPHLAVLETVFTAQGWSGSLTVASLLDPDVTNTDVAADVPIAHRHLRTVTAEQVGAVALLETETIASKIRVAQAAVTRVAGGPADPDPAGAPERPYVGPCLRLDLTDGEPVTVTKVVATVTSRDTAVASPAGTARAVLDRAADSAALHVRHARAWGRLWRRFDTDLAADEATRVAVRLYTYHLLTTISPHLDELDAGMGARGLHGEGYHGHVFWDEIFALPVLNLRQAALARALLHYRHRRLDEARAAARAAGLPGAMFPWESGSDGREQTPGTVRNPRTGRWMPNHSCHQRHVGLAVAYNAWHHYQVTADLEFLTEVGGDLIIEVARCLAALARYDPTDDRYHIEHVLGPDEFHDGYPDAPGQGVRDNAYTNVMTAWVLRRALEVVRTLAGYHCGDLWDRLDLHDDEIVRWEEVSRRIAVPFHADGVISQFAGYEQLAELDWAGYRARYGDLSRLDLILDAEGDSPNRYRLAKQADTLMLFYLLSAEELRDLLHSLGYEFDAAALLRTVAFYRDRVTHASTLSRVVHAWVLARADRPGAWQIFREALDADLMETRGSTREGIHLGAMAGVLDILQRCYTGLEARDDALWLNPRLPRELGGLRFHVAYRGQEVVIDVNHERVELALRPCAAAPIDVVVAGNRCRLSAGEFRRFVLPAPRGAALAAPEPPDR